MFFADLRLHWVHSLGYVAHLPHQLDVITGQGIDFFLVPFHHDGFSDRRDYFFVVHLKVGADGLVRLLVVRLR